MPLKHLTETVLVIVLALMIIVMGVLVRSTPAFPAGFVPLLLLFGVGLLYAAALAPLLRRNRADYQFRLLHLVPAAMPLIVLLVALASRYWPLLTPLLKFLTWGFLLPLVVLSVLLIAFFCVHVLRRRTPRLAALAALLVLFIPFAIWGERAKWEDNLTAMVWGVRTSTGMLVMNNTSSSSNSSKSSQKSSLLAAGQTWSEKLEADLAQRRSSMSSRPESRPPPPALPSAGPEAPFVLAGIAMYSGVLHARARRRSQRI